MGHKSTCMVNADKECGYCTCGADREEEGEARIAELEQQLSSTVSARDITIRDLRAELATTKALLDGTTSAIPAIVASHTKLLRSENERLRDALTLERQKRM
jgi:hypothetical protein